ncbi:MAG: tRNA (adenosine(37)-N6)-threonylcarbamoyltransferase complex ATPase subunit type 1 TsaE [Defluviitaleaceae bacterium]|nr:tRNA (adenosine(37)-N6)-threonylcarbamoyltransferase complex ATPase subunit type 1 TsaE [Defluviitaleaceae bacterium]
MIYESFSLNDTMTLAKDIAKKAKVGDIICLSGELGAGKTAFAKGFAQGLGISDHISSPTFTLMQLYDHGRLPLYHFDLYRLAEEMTTSYHSTDDKMRPIEQIDEWILDDIGFFEYLNSNGICLIEWAEHAQHLIPSTAIWIRIRRVYDGSIAEKRTIHICGL